MVNHQNVKEPFIIENNSNPAISEEVRSYVKQEIGQVKSYVRQEIRNEIKKVEERLNNIDKNVENIIYMIQAKNAKKSEKKKKSYSHPQSSIEQKQKRQQQFNYSVNDSVQIKTKPIHKSMKVEGKSKSIRQKKFFISQNNSSIKSIYSRSNKAHSNLSGVLQMIVQGTMNINQAKKELHLSEKTILTKIKKLKRSL